MTRLLVALAASCGLFLHTSTASAAALNDPGCRPSSAHPYPVVVVHGQAGNFEGMTAVTGALVQAGYCVYAKNYGFVPGGANGQDHLSASADQIGAQINDVLAKTGATKVDVVGHSAGTGVLANYILAKGGAAKVHNAVSFGGLHHPYAHVGVGKFADASLSLPTMIAAARVLFPTITAQQVVKTALGLYSAAGAPLGMVDPGLRATMESNFTSDLFDPDYWTKLHGALSEAPGNFITIGRSERSRPTLDAAPNVCYTNIVAVADLLAGPAAGFQDEASNVDNFLLVTTVTTNAHNDMLGDPIALAKMMTGLGASCAPAPPKTIVATNTAPDTVQPDESAASDEFNQALANAFAGDDPDGAHFANTGGCSMTRRPSTGVGLWLLVGFGLFFTRRRNASRCDVRNP